MGCVDGVCRRIFVDGLCLMDCFGRFSVHRPSRRCCPLAMRGSFSPDMVDVLIRDLLIASFNRRGSQAQPTRRRRRG